MKFVRFQAVQRGQDGLHVGVFGLVNTLAKQGRLTEAQEHFRRENNGWFDANYTNPSDVDAMVYDRNVNAGAVAWFKDSAEHLIARVDGYLDILASHGVSCHRVESEDPGRVIYEDEGQIVVVPA